MTAMGIQRGGVRSPDWPGWLKRLDELLDRAHPGWNDTDRTSRLTPLEAAELDYLMRRYVREHIKTLGG